MFLVLSRVVYRARFRAREKGRCAGFGHFFFSQSNAPPLPPPPPTRTVTPHFSTTTAMPGRVPLMAAGSRRALGDIGNQLTGGLTARNGAKDQPVKYVVARPLVLLFVPRASAHS